MARLRFVFPNLRVSTLQSMTSHFRRAGDLALYEEGLRRAGLPE